MLKLELTGVTKRFDPRAGAVVRGIDMRLAEAQMLVLLGPSGCGKTTILRMVAGLLNPDEGTIAVDGETVAGPGWGWLPERRNLGMVFQSYAVWPHKTVFENVAYGLTLRRTGRDEIRRRVQQALELVKLGGLGERYPAEISGGQQQRVALARAIVVEPSLLLLDEPLSNLDAALREQMRVELKTLQQQLGLASIYVTHDQAEAMVLADHLIVMKDGVIAQEGSPEEIYRRPASKFIAGFLGVANLPVGRVTDTRGNEASVELTGLGHIRSHVTDDMRKKLAPGDAACVSIRPIDLKASLGRPAEDVNAFQGKVMQRIFFGDLTEYLIQTGDIRWRLHALSSQPLALEQSVWITFDPQAATALSDA